MLFNFVTSNTSNNYLNKDFGIIKLTGSKTMSNHNRNAGDLQLFAFFECFGAVLFVGKVDVSNVAFVDNFQIVRFRKDDFEHVRGCRLWNIRNNQLSRIDAI